MLCVAGHALSAAIRIAGGEASLVSPQPDTPTEGGPSHEHLPALETPLRPAEYGAGVEACECCGGHWMSPDELRDVLDSGPRRSRAGDGGAVPVRVPIGEVGEDLPCPACGTTMAAFNYAGDSGIILDRCGPCEWLGLDAGELRRVRRFAAAAREGAGRDAERFAGELRHEEMRQDALEREDTKGTPLPGLTAAASRAADAIEGPDPAGRARPYGRRGEGPRRLPGGAAALTSATRYAAGMAVRVAEATGSSADSGAGHLFPEDLPRRVPTRSVCGVPRQHPSRRTPRGHNTFRNRKARRATCWWLPTATTAGRQTTTRASRSPAAPARSRSASTM